MSGMNPYMPFTAARAVITANIRMLIAVRIRIWFSIVPVYFLPVLVYKSSVTFIKAKLAF